MNREEIIQAISDDKMMPFIQPEQLAGIVDFVIKNYRPSLPSNLDEAAFSYENDLWESGFKECGYSPQEVSDAFKAGAEWQEEQDLAEMAQSASPLSVAYANRCFENGKQAMKEQMLNAAPRWISVDEKLPEMDEEVIVLTDELGTAPIYKIGFGHIVDVKRCIDYNGWNCPGVKYWMPCPKIPNND